MRDELSVREIKVKEVDTRIEGEINGLRAQMEGVKARESFSRCIKCHLSSNFRHFSSVYYNTSSGL